MSPLRSSAGPATWRIDDVELAADDLRERGLAEPGRPGEQHVVERLAAAARRVERDPELLLDPLLADELGERARAGASCSSSSSPPSCDDGREHALAHAAFFSAERTCSSTERLVDVGERALGVDSDQPSSTSASRASELAAGRTGARPARRACP